MSDVAKKRLLLFAFLILALVYACFVIPFVISSQKIYQEPRESISYVGNQPIEDDQGYRWDKEIEFPEESPRGGSGEIQCLSALDESRLLVSTKGTGHVYMYDVAYWEEEPVYAYELQTIKSSGSGKIWALSKSDLLYYDGSSWKANITSYSSTSFDNVYTEDPGLVWITTQDSSNDQVRTWGAYSFNGTYFEKRYEASSPINDIGLLAQDDVWMLSSHHLFHYDGNEWNKVRYPYYLYGFVCLDQAHMWGFTDEQIYFFDGSEWQKQWAGYCSIKDMVAIDSEHVWALVSSKTSGYSAVLFYNGSSWEEQCTIHAKATVLTAVDIDHVWVGCSDGKVLSFDEGTWYVDDIGVSKPITALAVTGDHVLRAAAGNAIYARVLVSEPRLTVNADLVEPEVADVSYTDSKSPPLAGPPSRDIGRSSIAYVKGNNIWISRFDGTDERRLTSEAEDEAYLEDEAAGLYIWNPSWDNLSFSPSGNKLAAWNEKGLVVIDVESGRQDILTDRLAGVWESSRVKPVRDGLCWRDEETIVCSATRYLNNIPVSCIISFNLSDGSSETLADFAHSPSLSSDGRKLAFIRSFSDTNFILLGNDLDAVVKDLVDGSETVVGAGIYEVTFGPIGYILACSTRGEPDEYIMYHDLEADIHLYLKCCGPSGHFSGLCFSPDGSMLMYCGSSYLNSAGEEYRMSSGVSMIDLSKPSEGGHYYESTGWKSGMCPAWSK